MQTIKCTGALRRFFPTLKDEAVKGNTVADAIAQFEQSYPGISDYLLDEQGALRKHVNIFIGGQLIQDRVNLKDKLEEGSEILIFQALSGG